MDKLEQAMQSEDFWIELADTSFGKVILHGKNTNSIADNILGLMIFIIPIICGKGTVEAYLRIFRKCHGKKACMP